MRLALKLFRGEPAISGFDWNFSAIHRSSPPFSTDVWFGPPWSFTSTSTCSWIGHPVSGLRHATIALFKLAFASAPNLQFLTSLHNVTRRSVLQKVRDRALTCTFTACKHRVSGSLSLPSRGSFHLSLTVLCAIGHHIVFRLGWWSTLLPAGFLVPCGTLVSAGCLTFSCTGLLPSLAELSISLLLKSHNAVCRPTTPGSMLPGLASFPFARRYLGNHYLFSLPAGT